MATVLLLRKKIIFHLLPSPNEVRFWSLDWKYYNYWVNIFIFDIYYNLSVVLHILETIRGLNISSKYDLDEITEFSKISTVSSIWSNNPITRCMHHNGIPLLCNVVLRRSRVSYLPYNLRWNLHWMSQFFFCQTQTKKKSKFDMIEFAISYNRNA